MKTAEDEAFEDIERRQGGFQAKRKMAADKLQEPWNEDEWRRNNWRCSHGWLRGEQCEICNAPQPVQEPATMDDRQRLEALKYAASKGYGRIVREMKIAPFTIKESLAQPVQEPSETRSCRSCNGTGQQYTGIDEAPTSICKPCDGTGQIALAQPPQREWVGLTKDEMLAVVHYSQLDNARAIEAKLKQKNT